MVKFVQVGGPIKVIGLSMSLGLSKTSGHIGCRVRLGRQVGRARLSCRDRSGRRAFRVVGPVRVVETIWVIRPFCIVGHFKVVEPVRVLG